MSLVLGHLSPVQARGVAGTIAAMVPGLALARVLLFRKRTNDARARKLKIDGKVFAGKPRKIQRFARRI
jgi:hypothetical protein